MTIRRQILLFVLPLFVVVGGLSSAFTLWLELSTLRKAYIDGSEAIAISAAEWIESEDISALRSGTPLAQTRLGPITERLLAWGHIRRFTLLDPDTAAPIADTAPSEGHVATAVDLKSLKLGEVLALPFRTARADSSQREPNLTWVGPRLAVLAVEVSADDYLATRHRIIREALMLWLLVITVGLVVAYFLGVALSRNFALLRQSVSAIGKPTFESIPQAGGVQEVADLASTFAVIHSLQVASAERTQRSLSDVDFQIDQRALNEIYHRALPKPDAWSLGSVSAAWLPIGTALPCMLAGVVAAEENKGVAFIGLAGLPDDLEAAVRADAAARFLTVRLARYPFEEAARETVNLFQLTRLSLMRWDTAGVSYWSTDPERTALNQHWTDQPIILSTLGPMNTERLDIFLSNFPNQTPAATLENFAPLASMQETGAVLLLRRARLKGTEGTSPNSITS
jgi:hypothetical protein